jgi:hypothetical protein
MAILYRTSIGHIRGKFGDTVIQRRFKKNIISLRPEHYITKSEKVKNNRKEFAIKVMFAKAINKCIFLVKCWENCNIKSISGYHNAISFNSKNIKNGVPTNNNAITPTYQILLDRDKSVFLKSVPAFLGNKISFDYSLEIPIEVDFKPTYVFVMVLVLMFSDGKADRISTMTFDKDVEVEEKTPEGINRLEFEFTDEETEYIKKYRLMRGYTAFVKPCLDTQNTCWTNSVFFEVNLKEFYNI